MEILISVIIGLLAVVVFIIMNSRNNRKMNEFDDFSREMKEREELTDREKRGSKEREIGDFKEDNYGENVSNQQKKTNNVDRFGHKIISVNDIVELDYSENYAEYTEEENREYMNLIFYARQNILLGKFEKAKKELEKAASFSIKGNYELGKYYYYCKKDNQSAMSMFDFAYNDGVREAAYYLGMLEEEAGNEATAKDWYNAGAEKGDVRSIVKLGKIAEEKKDYENAQNFYLKVADTKDAKVIYNLVRLYFKQNMTEKVAEWQRKMLNEKQITGLTFEIIKNIEFMLGNEKDRKFMELIIQGNEFLEKKDYENAQKLFLEATNYNEIGYLTLAKLYYATGDGEKAKSTFEKAYELGVKEAAYYLGEHSDIKEDNVKEAEKWYKIGQEMGDVKSIYELAILYECEEEFGKSEKEAYQMYEKIANLKYSPAMSDVMFYSGREESDEKTKEWATKILNGAGLIELDNSILRNAQEVLEECGEHFENRILAKDDGVDYDENLIYFIEENSKVRNV